MLPNHYAKLHGDLFPRQFAKVPDLIHVYLFPDLFAYSLKSLLHKDFIHLLAQTIFWHRDKPE
jgi:hypothetical protein